MPLPSIEDIVEKCRSLGNDEAQLERVRDDLKTQDCVGLLDAYLWLFGSQERIIPLWRSTVDAPVEVFWRAWLDNWNICDGTERRLPRGLLLNTLRCRSRERSALEFHDGQDGVLLNPLLGH